MSEIKLTIDEVIEHCRKTCERAELMAQLRDAEITSKQYWEHKQVAEWLKELKQLRGAVERIVTRLEEEKDFFKHAELDYGIGSYRAFGKSIQVIKEEGGIE